MVSPFRKPKTQILTGPIAAPLRCPSCGNDDPNRFLTVTSLGGNSLHGFVCAPCEAHAIDNQC